MCGLVWVSSKHAAELAPAALKRLEYRGYDSFGFAWPASSGIESYKSLDDLRSFQQNLPNSDMVLGHTRWATHGEVSLSNCHPHVDAKRRFALAHNGIASIEAETEALNGKETRTNESDTAALTRKLSELLDQGIEPADGFDQVVDGLVGRNALVVMFASGEVFAFRQGSPLLLLELDSGYAIASDLLALAANTKACRPLKDGDRMYFYRDQVRINGEAPDWQVFSRGHAVEDAASSVSPGSYMHSEMLEQWRTLIMPVLEANGAETLVEMIRQRGSLVVTGAGGAGLVAQQVAYLLNTRTPIAATAISACEFASQVNVARGAGLLALSQSGETADTLVAIEHARHWQMPVASLVNMPLSTMASVSDVSYQLGVGPERCVLSTKSATAQIAFGYWLSSVLSESGAQAQQELEQLCIVLSQTLTPALFGCFAEAVEYLSQQERVFLLGRGVHYATAQLGALNLKEASYIHAEAFSAGELKHGVIALIEPGTPVILFGLEQDEYMVSVAAELKARGACIIAVGSNLGDMTLPDPGAGHVVSAPMTCQILAYLLARHRGIDPDRPRNLAKSVTVL